MLGALSHSWVVTLAWPLWKELTLSIETDYIYTLWLNNSTPRFITNGNTCTWALRDKDENLRDALFVMAPNNLNVCQRWNGHKN